MIKSWRAKELISFLQCKIHRFFVIFYMMRITDEYDDSCIVINRETAESIDT